MARVIRYPDNVTVGALITFLNNCDASAIVKFIDHAAQERPIANVEDDGKTVYFYERTE